jgi:hypothetical protein
MKRLKVTGAVRPLYGSLGVKGLMVTCHVQSKDYQNYGRDEHLGVTRPISRAVNSRNNNANVIIKMTGSTGWGSVHSALLKIR